MRLTEGLAVRDLISVTGTISGMAIDPRGFAGSGPLVMMVSGASGAHAAITGGLTTTPPSPFDTLGVGSGVGRFVQSGRDGTSTCTLFGWGILRFPS